MDKAKILELKVPLDNPLTKISTDQLYDIYGPSLYVKTIDDQLLLEDISIVELGILKRFLVEVATSVLLGPNHQYNRPKILICIAPLTEEELRDLIKNCDPTNMMMALKSVILTLGKISISDELIGTNIAMLNSIFMRLSLSHQEIAFIAYLSKWSNENYVDLVVDYLPSEFEDSAMIEAIREYKDEIGRSLVDRDIFLNQYFRRQEYNIYKPIPKLDSEQLEVLENIYANLTKNQITNLMTIFLSHSVSASCFVSFFKDKIKFINSSNRNSNNNSKVYPPSKEVLTKGLELLLREEQRKALPESSNQVAPYPGNNTIGKGNMNINNNNNIGKSNGNTNNTIGNNTVGKNNMNINNNNNDLANFIATIDISDIDVTLDECFLFPSDLAYYLLPDSLRNPKDTWSLLNHYVGFDISTFDLSHAYITGSVIPAVFLLSPLLPEIAPKDFIDLYYPNKVYGHKDYSYLGQHYVTRINTLRALYDVIAEGIAISGQLAPLLSNPAPGADLDIVVDDKLTDYELKGLSEGYLTIVNKTYPQAILKVETKPGGGIIYNIIGAHRDIQIYRSSLRQIMTHHLGMVRAFVTGNGDQRDCYFSTSCLLSVIRKSSINYYYFAGKKSKAIDVILKYIKRGWVYTGENSRRIMEYLEREISFNSSTDLKNYPYSFFTIQGMPLDKYDLYLKYKPYIDAQAKLANPKSVDIPEDWVFDELIKEMAKDARFNPLVKMTNYNNINPRPSSPQGGNNQVVLHPRINNIPPNSPPRTIIYPIHNTEVDNDGYSNNYHRGNEDDYNSQDDEDDYNNQDDEDQ